MRAKPPEPSQPQPTMAAMLAPFKELEWIKLTPRERLRRAWALRARIRDPQAWHDQKLFPKP